MDRSSPSPAEGHRKNSDPGKLLKGEEKKQRKNLSSVLTPAFTDTPKSRKADYTVT